MTKQSTAEFLAEIDAEIASLDEQIKPLQDRRADLHTVRREARDLLAAETTDEPTLARMSADCSVAADKVQHAARRMHPMILGTSHWLPVREHRHDTDYSQGHFTGVQLGLRRDATTEDLAALAEAMVEFSQRFQPVLPDYPEWASFEDGKGAAYADPLAYDLSMQHSWMLWYEPTPGGRAVLIDERFSRGVQAEGTLIEVLTEAVKVAYYED